VKTFGLVLAGVAAGALCGQVAASELARQLNDSFAGVYERVAPAVVVIEVKGGRAAPVSRLPRGLDFFFRTPDGSQQEDSPEQGSGFVIRPEGYILTNNHVVQNAEGGTITITMQDGRKFPARLIGRDEVSDIAVLKVEATNLPTVELGDSDVAKVGQFAFAIGAPFDLPYTFTVGVISAKGRSALTGLTPYYEEFIQTDASINPGNSGGPLCDLDGRVVGVNTLISGINRGLGFAVPINIARTVAEQLITTGRVSRPWLGIGIVGLEDNERVKAMFPGVESGVLVESIEADAPAYRSRLQPGDVILEVDGAKVAAASDLQREVLKKAVGQSVVLDVWRKGRVVRIDIQTGEQPDRLMRASSRALPTQPPAAPPAAPQEDVPLMRPDPPSTSDTGVQGMTLRESARGLVVEAVAAGSPAEEAGVRVGDILVEVGGRASRAVKDVEELFAQEQSEGRRGVMLLIEREGQKTFAIVKP
jgi:Do/DeqQ family serine protease